jgi:hypothetical protein
MMCVGGACSAGMCCMNACSGPAKCASATTLQTCQVGPNGCTVAVVSPCPNGGACNQGQGACCPNPCTQGGTTCSGSDLLTCIQGPDGCWSYGMPVPCASGACKVNACCADSCCGCPKGFACDGAGSCMTCVPPRCF